MSLFHREESDGGKISVEDLRLQPNPSSVVIPSRAASPVQGIGQRRLIQMAILIEQETCDLVELRKLAWSGVPMEVRATVWQLMLGYLPAVKARREASLQRRRQDYRQIVEQNFAAGVQIDQATFHQISIDVPRTCPEVALFRNVAVRQSLTRILYCWAIRRPASGYVQGINDLVTPFYDVFLQNLITQDVLQEGSQVVLTDAALMEVEADAFWCSSILLDSMQDSYIEGQAGIFRQVERIRELVRRCDPALVGHLDGQGVQFNHFAYRWVNCLLMREFPLHMIIRMWDTYFAECNGELMSMTSFHVHVCAAFLTKWSHRLRHMEFQDIVLWLQNPPTNLWSLADLETLLSEAYVWKTLFPESTKHLSVNNKS